MHPAIRTAIFPAVLSIVTTLVGSVCAAGTSVPAVVTVTDIQASAAPAFGAAVRAYEKAHSGHVAPSGCRYLQTPVEADGNPASREWLLREAANCAGHNSQRVWLLQEQSGAIKVLLADDASSVTFNPPPPASAGARTILFQWLMDLPASLKQRIPYPAGQVRCGSIWQGHSGQYRRVSVTEPLISVDDPVAGGWIERALGEFLPDPQHLCYH